MHRHMRIYYMCIYTQLPARPVFMMCMHTLCAIYVCTHRNTQFSVIQSLHGSVNMPSWNLNKMCAVLAEWVEWHKSMRLDRRKARHWLMGKPQSSHYISPSKKKFSQCLQGRELHASLQHSILCTPTCTPHQDVDEVAQSWHPAHFVHNASPIKKPLYDSYGICVPWC